MVLPCMPAKRQPGPAERTRELTWPSIPTLLAPCFDRHAPSNCAWCSDAGQPATVLANGLGCIQWLSGLLFLSAGFHYAGYEMTPEDLREWVSQALRCGASAIDYYEMDSPRWSFQANL